VSKGGAWGFPKGVADVEIVSGPRCKTAAMSLERSCRPALVAVALVIAGCRDEQAGPKAPQPPPPAGGGAQSSGPAVAATSPGRVLEEAPSQLTFQSGATWAGGAVEYLGTLLDPPKLKPGQPLRLHHYFRAKGAQPAGFQFFVHLIDSGSGQMVANLDHEVQGGAMPLGRWPPGKVVEDVHEVFIPQGFAGGARVAVGFWQGDRRLPVDDPSAHDGDQRMLGPVLEAETGPLPSYTVKRAKPAPAIDGALNDPAWANAAAVELSGSFDGRPTSVRTTARLLYDDQHLYLSFDAEDPHIWGTLFKRDEPIYTQEAVEVFVDADGDGRTYNEIQVSPNGTLFDAYFPARRQGMDLSWDSGTEAAVRFSGTINNPSDKDERWTVEMKIPVARLAGVKRPPKKGDHWRFNLYRLDGAEGGQEGMAFSPLFVGDFHHLPRFGRLHFD
jgi:hypothetical protein